MPQGVMQWFDDRAGEGRVVASKREYPAYVGEVEPRARKTGARVHFDVERVEGVPTAVRVRLRPGTRNSPRQGRMGTLAGVARPEEKGRAPLTRRRTAVDAIMPGRPVALVRRWLVAADSGRLDEVLPLYAPHALLHAPDGEVHGRPAIRAYLLDSGLLTRGWDPTPRGVEEGETVEAVRTAMAPDAGLLTRFRVAHGQIAEQWVKAP